MRPHGLCAVVAITILGGLHLGGCGKGPSLEGAGGSEKDVIALEEMFRVAKLRNDVASLQGILADEYVGLNENGRTRTKSQVLELFRTFRIDSLEVTRASIRLSGPIAVVTGSQVQHTCVVEKMLFLRTYVARRGQWQLLSNTQFRRPEDTALAQKASSPQ